MNIGKLVTGLFSNQNVDDGFKNTNGDRGQKIGSTIGDIAGSMIPIPGVSNILSSVGGMFGKIFDPMKHGSGTDNSVPTTANPYGQMKNGGLIKYNGSKHENGGIPIGKNMQPTDRKNAIAEVEDGETAYNDYVFSDTLGINGKTFAKMSKKIENKYKGRKDDLAKKTMNLELSKLMGSNEQERVKEESINNFKNGGKLNKYPDGGAPLEDITDPNAYINNLLGLNNNAVIGNTLEGTKSDVSKLTNTLGGNKNNTGVIKNLNGNTNISLKDKTPVKGTSDSYFDLTNPFDDRVITSPGNSVSMSDYETSLKYPNPNQVTPMKKHRREISAETIDGSYKNPNLNISSDRLIDPELAAKYDKQQQAVERQTAIRDALGANSDNENLSEEEAEKKGLHYLTPAIIGKGTELLGKGAMMAQGYDKVDPNYNRYESKVKDIMSKRGVDMDAVTNQINLARNARLKSNQNARSLNVKRSLDSQAYATTSQELSQAELQKQQINNQLRGEEARQLDTLGQQRVQSETYAEDAEARNKGQFFTNMGTFLGDIGRAGAFGSKYLANDYKSKEMLELLNNAYEDFGVSKDLVERLNNGTATDEDMITLKKAETQLKNKPK